MKNCEQTGTVQAALPTWLRSQGAGVDTGRQAERSRRLETGAGKRTVRARRDL